MSLELFAPTLSHENPTRRQHRRMRSWLNGMLALDFFGRLVGQSVEDKCISQTYILLTMIKDREIKR